MGKEEETGESHFGFKDQAKAEETINLLTKHDIQYQKLTVRGLLGRAKRVLTSKYFCSSNITGNDSSSNSIDFQNINN